MNIGRIDVFEDEAEITKIVSGLQKKGLEYMRVPDDLWDTKAHSNAMKSIRKIERKILKTL